LANRKVEFHPSADAEVTEAQAWYAARSEVAASAFTLEFDGVVERIAVSPERWPADVDGTRRAVFPRFPFNLIYRLRGKILEVVAVAHQRRRPGYWRGR
jgi:plasmid stabilization system protein ParE